MLNGAQLHGVSVTKGDVFGKRRVKGTAFGSVDSTQEVLFETLDGDHALRGGC